MKFNTKKGHLVMLSDVIFAKTSLQSPLTNFAFIFSTMKKMKRKCLKKIYFVYVTKFLVDLGEIFPCF